MLGLAVLAANFLGLIFLWLLLLRILWQIVAGGVWSPWLAELAAFGALLIFLPGWIVGISGIFFIAQLRVSR